MAASRTQTIHKELHLKIDPSPYDALHHNPYTPDSISPSSSSARASIATTSEYSDTGILCSVLCMYEFRSDDPDHLPFHRNEILDVVRQEDTGWWAAMRRDSDFIGWIPEQFVRPLSAEMAIRLRNVREELRIYEYEAEQLYLSAPVSYLPLEEDDSDEPEPDPAPPYEHAISPQAGRVEAHQLPASDHREKPLPLSPHTPMHPPPFISQSAPRPMPAVPAFSSSSSSSSSQPSSQLQSHTSSSSYSEPPTHQLPLVPNRDRSGSDPYSSRRQLPPVTMPERRSGSPTASLSSRSPDASSKRRAEKIAWMTGSENAVDFHQALYSAWYLKPKHSDQLQTDSEGLVRTATIPALVEKLTSDTLSKDPLKSAQETHFREVFLTTFRTFMTADQLFDMLTGIYHMDVPDKLTEPELTEWKDKRLFPTQRLVLQVFRMWLENFRLLEEEPNIAGRLTEFLTAITSPQWQAHTANIIVQSIQRLTFEGAPQISSTFSLRKRRKTKQHNGDLRRLDPTDVAEQLALIEYNLYSKITPQECLSYAKTQKGKAVANLNGFCATHDKLAAWVQSSILYTSALSKRAEMVDFWIKIAEKCRNMNNFSSMSSIINALSSSVITRLHLTWATCNRRSALDALLKYNDPSGMFAGYRSLQQRAEGPCVPFIGMYLTEILHIKDQFSDDDSRSSLSSTTSATLGSEGGLEAAGRKISFVQRQRWFEVARTILRFQKRPYMVAESDSTRMFIQGNLRAFGYGDREQEAKFWARSKEMQQRELEHADIRIGLEAAGF